LSSIVRSVLIASTFLALGGVAFAGGRPPGSPAGFDKPPTNAQIRDRLQDICTGLLKDDKVAAATATRRCGCYANGVVKAMTDPEIDEMRTTGRFSSSAEPKAKRFMASCGVKR
jgi:hypothetical protein